MYAIRVVVVGHTDPWWCDQTDTLHGNQSADGSTIITGHLRDLAECYGFLLQLQDQHIVPLSIQIRKKGFR